MKNIFLIMIIAALTGNVYGQDNSLNDRGEAFFSKVEKVEGQIADGKAFIKWNSLSNDPEHYFLVERAGSDKQFEVIGVKKGLVSPEGVSLMNCFTDLDADAGLNIYRIRTVAGDQSELVSAELQINLSSAQLALQPREE